MEKMIAFCGITCTDCKAFIATKKNDEMMRKEIARDWKVEPKEVNCDGCANLTGSHINFWSTCEIRNCALKRKVENCAHCIEYACGKLAKLHEHAQKAKETLEEINRQLSI
jgi:hypothetical protein